MHLCSARVSRRFGSLIFTSARSVALRPSVGFSLRQSGSDKRVNVPESAFNKRTSAPEPRRKPRAAYRSAWLAAGALRLSPAVSHFIPSAFDASAFYAPPFTAGMPGFYIRPSLAFPPIFITLRPPVPISFRLVSSFHREPLDFHRRYTTKAQWIMPRTQSSPGGTSLSVFLSPPLAAITNNGCLIFFTT